MEMVPVDSSMISEVGYDEAEQELEVFFNSGRIYRYEDVPRKIYDNLLKAEWNGRLMRANIIDVYPDHDVSRRKRSRSGR